MSSDAPVLTRQPRPTTDPEKAEEPPKRWKNRWLVVKPHSGYCTICIKVDAYDIGDEYISCCLSWPTEGEARQAVSVMIKDPSYAVYRGSVKYLGPIQVPAPSTDNGGCL